MSLFLKYFEYFNLTMSQVLLVFIMHSVFFRKKPWVFLNQTFNWNLIHCSCCCWIRYYFTMSPVFQLLIRKGVGYLILIFGLRHTTPLVVYLSSSSLELPSVPSKIYISTSSDLSLTYMTNFIYNEFAGYSTFPKIVDWSLDW